MYYSSRLISEQLESGQSYREMKHVICIHLLDFDLFPEHPEQASWRFELRDQHIPDVVLTKAQQIDILELDKADRLQLAPTALKNWVDLFEHWQEQHIMAQLTHTPVMTVLQSLEQMSQTKEERLRALARERAVWDYNTDIITAREEGLEEGMQKGLQQGMQKGLEKGIQAMQTLLRTLIEARFGQPLPDWVLSRLRAATPEQLQQWGVSLTQAQRLEDIFEG